VISATREENRSLYGATIWIVRRCKGIDAARCTVERLMIEPGLHGVLRGRAPRATETPTVSAVFAQIVVPFIRGVGFVKQEGLATFYGPQN
jgi:hypothetical protein